MAFSVNRVELLGNITRTPEMRYTQSGTAVLTIDLATNSSYKNKSTGEYENVPEYHKVVVWSKGAEYLNGKIDKGDKIYVSGRLQTRKWEDRNGVTRYQTEVIANEYVPLTPKKTSTQRAPVGDAPADADNTNIAQEAEELFEVTGKDVPADGSIPKGQEPEMSSTGVDEINIEDIPF